MMNKKFSILVIEHGEEYELCQCDTNPEQIIDALKSETLKIYKSPIATRRSSVPKYVSVRYVERA